jgi:hypothetical protein
MPKITRRAAVQLAATTSAVAAALARIDRAAFAQEERPGPLGGGPLRAPPRPPWEKRRGLLTTDYNNYLVFVRAPIDDLARAVADRTERWERDVLGQDVILSQNSAFVFRLRSHNWTIVAPEPFTAALDEQLSSRGFNARVISYGVSDTTGSIAYSLYENGELLEQFNATEGDHGRPDSSSSFTSRLRALKLEKIPNIWAFTQQFLVEQDVLEPGVDFGYFLRPFPGWPFRGGETVRVANPGFTIMQDDSRFLDVPPIERVDYWVLRRR